MYLSSCVWLSRQLWVVLICAMVALTVGCPPDKSANSAADFSLPQVRGGTFRLHSEPPGPLLLAFVQTVPDTSDTPSRSQVVFVKSMAQQYGPRGLRVVVIDASALVNHRPPDHDDLVNASYDWHMDVPLLEDAGNQIARRLNVTEVPTLLLVAPDGTIFRRWQGLTQPAVLAQGIERLVGGPLGRLPNF